MFGTPDASIGPSTETAVGCRRWTRNRRERPPHGACHCRRVVVVVCRSVPWGGVWFVFACGCVLVVCVCVCGECASRAVRVRRCRRGVAVRRWGGCWKSRGRSGAVERRRTKTQEEEGRASKLEAPESYRGHHAAAKQSTTQPRRERRASRVVVVVVVRQPNETKANRARHSHTHKHAHTRARARTRTRTRARVGTMQIHPHGTATGEEHLSNVAGYESNFDSRPLLPGAGTIDAAYDSWKVFS
jgi:hypothetical protein